MDASSQPDLGEGEEKEMAYYLAKIKAKAAQKTQELRSSMESSRTESDPPPTSVRPNTAGFVKPQTPAQKKRMNAPKKGSSLTGPVKSLSAKREGGGAPTKSKVPARVSNSSVSKSRIVAESPVAAYIRGGKPGRKVEQPGRKVEEPGRKVEEPGRKVEKQEQLGSTWTALTDRSLVEVVQSDGDVDAWRELYRRTQQELAQVQEQLLRAQDEQEGEQLLLETGRRTQIEQVKTDHHEEIQGYKQEIYVLESRVKSAAMSDPGTQAGELVKQIQQLETLLAGNSSYSSAPRTVPPTPCLLSLL